MKRFPLLCAALLFLMLLPSQHAPARAAGVSIAVLSISSDGIDPWWNGSFDPGKALQTLIDNDLVATSRFTVVEREQIQAVFDEQKYSTSADFSADDAVSLGHTLGARYLIVGRVVHLDKVAENKALVGSIISQSPINIGGAGTDSEKVHLEVALRAIDATTGQIVGAYTFDESKSGTSVLVGDISDNVGGYSSQQFTSSTIGQLMTDAAQQLTQKIAATDFSAPAVTPVNATIIALDGGNVVIDAGSAEGVSRGMYLKAFHVVTARDPRSGKTLNTRVPNGELQIISVDQHSSVARVISGQNKVGDIAQTP